MPHIITEGVAPLDKPRKRTCPKCRSKVGYTLREASSSCDPREPGQYIHCPKCQAFIWVKT